MHAAQKHARSHLSAVCRLPTGPRRQLNHEAGPLQEFLRLHAAFNGNRAASIRVRGPAGCPACPAAFLLPGMRWHARWAGL